jgi:hypothetical protein
MALIPRAAGVTVITDVSISRVEVHAPIEAATVEGTFVIVIAIVDPLAEGLLAYIAHRAGIRVVTGGPIYHRLHA